MRISLRQQAMTHERYAPDAFAGQIGKRVPLTINDRTVRDCEIVDVVVSPDGSEVAITYEMPADTAAFTGPWHTHTNGTFSAGSTPE